MTIEVRREARDPQRIPQHGAAKPIGPPDLSRINFGAPAAERDDTLTQYFVESDAFKAVRSGQKYVVLGNRGSGKSAIFRILAEREKVAGSVVIQLSPDDYSYEMLSAVMRAESDGSWAKQGAYTAAWKYLLYIQIMKELNRLGSKFKRGAAAKVYSYLRDHIEGQQGNPIGMMVSYLKRMEGLKIGSYEASVKSKELEKLYKLDEILELIPSIVEVCERYRIVVLIDELDKGWDSSEDAKSFIAGLFQAAIAINQHHPNLRVIVSLRQELYDSIPALYEDAQKYRDVMQFVYWDEESLLKLLAKRIRHAAPALTDCSDVDSWTSIFPETLDYRNSKSFNYLVDRTLYRPREIIQFASDVIETAKRNVDREISYATITQAELIYSQTRTQDIAAEYKFQYPNLLSIFEQFRGRTYSFTRAEAESIATEISLKEPRSDSPTTWAHLQEPEVLLDVLWRVGFLRAQIVGGMKARRRSGSQYVGSHQVNSINLRSVTRYQVHPMFRTYLSMKEPKSDPILEFEANAATTDQI
jgi:energy-coupling factor transporter ATP-binding protein EcfA2